MQECKQCLLETRLCLMQNPNGTANLVQLKIVYTNQPFKHTPFMPKLLASTLWHAMLLWRINYTQTLIIQF